MKRAVFYLFLILFPLLAAGQKISDYNVVWNTPSKHSGESMPCGGGDVGLNVWVENGDILFYMARSGTFDENNTLLKQGRIRIQLSPNPLEGEYFRQELQLEEGCIMITGKKDGIIANIRIWADVFQPVIHAETSGNTPLQAIVSYENWRYEDRLLRKNESNQNSYKWASPRGLKTKKDHVFFEDNRIVFYHRNEGKTVFDATVCQQGLDSVKGQLFNPLRNLIFGGIIEAPGFRQAETADGIYGDTDYKAWQLASIRPLKKWSLSVRLHTAQTEDAATWKKFAQNKLVSNKKKNIEWWKTFWERSFIHICTGNDSTGFKISRNYQLFRYMLACNAMGNYPTKFNGGLFTFDPVHVDSAYRFTPDFRKWGGGTHTAQNQRLVYFPMLKSGDFDLMTPQFDFYRRNLSNAELRSRIYWNHGGACFTEQMENFGLPNPSEYAWKRPDGYDPGMEYNQWLEYQWDTVLEFCFMILEKERYTGNDISGYIPLIESCLRFFDEHYHYLAKQRGAKALDANGKLVFYPGSACETYKMAYNATSTIAALHTVTSRLLELPGNYLDSTRRTYYEQFLNRLPEIHTRQIGEHTTLAPAWQWERINNTESPQLYPVFPWGMYGLNKPGLETAINTYHYDPDVVRFRDYKGWKQDAIWAARLGLAEEAKDLLTKKLQDSGQKFPAFWGPGFDWTPDHNWGGSGMIALQEMLLQIDGNNALLLPAWPAGWDVHFKLHAPYNTTIECKYRNGKIEKLISINDYPQNYSQPSKWGFRTAKVSEKVQIKIACTLPSPL
ncbi:MAG: DUF5703 domain-containing protein [Dysgonamonadaceae bacterium]|jgi:hypothetical protein|nr:DUF5703 domain-containing protein [Dysgonamonadaceae bacterium]